MIWGSQYDAMLRWGLTGADKAKVNGTGNAAHDLSTVYETGKETVYGKKDRINNIYDLEGNGLEWTAETFSTNSREYRGATISSAKSPANRYNQGPEYPYNYFCSRAVLYIK